MLDQQKNKYYKLYTVYEEFGFKMTYFILKNRVFLLYYHVLLCYVLLYYVLC